MKNNMHGSQEQLVFPGTPSVNITSPANTIKMTENILKKNHRHQPSSAQKKKLPQLPTPQLSTPTLNQYYNKISPLNNPKARQADASHPQINSKQVISQSHTPSAQSSGLQIENTQKNKDTLPTFPRNSI